MRCKQWKYDKYSTYQKAVRFFFHEQLFKWELLDQKKMWIDEN